MPMIFKLLKYDPFLYRRIPWGLPLHDWNFRITPHELSTLFDFPKVKVQPDIAKEQQRSKYVGKNGFQASIDVKHFKPDEISVKTVDNTVIVEGKHESKDEQNGSVLRHFIRKYELPKGYDPTKLESQLSSDGVLTINAPAPKEAIKQSNERVVQIQQTGPAHNVKHPAENGKDSKDAKK